MDVVASPEDLLGQPVPDLRLRSTAGGDFGLRERVGVGALALFFIIRNGTSG